MGLPRAEIEAKLDEVIEFTGLAASINLPLNTYSVGMRSRLAFGRDPSYPTCCSWTRPCGR